MQAFLLAMVIGIMVSRLLGLSLTRTLVYRKRMRAVFVNAFLVVQIVVVSTLSVLLLSKLIAVEGSNDASKV